MEKLPNQFMFKHYSNDEDVYAASRFNDEYLVSWIGKDGVPDNSLHMIEHVEHYVKNNIWIIL